MVTTPLDPIARVCHEVNRAYCQALGDNSQPAWDDAPEWQRSSARMGVDLHLMGDFGPEASHASWLKQKLEEGWVYGSTKNPERKEHPCMVPFEDLPREQQAKDFIFRGVVQALKGSLLQPKITGYRQLSPEEAALMNEGKALAEQVGAYINKLRTAPGTPATGSVDQRWVSVGATQLQQGFMAAIRAIARPETF
jgi:RyR domain